MKAYYTGSWGFTIDEVELTRKSDSSVWYIHRGRERRESNTCYFDTWEEAKQAIVDRETRHLNEANKAVERAKESLSKAYSISRDDKR